MKVKKQLYRYEAQAEPKDLKIHVSSAFQDLKEILVDFIKYRKEVPILILKVELRRNGKSKGGS